MLPTTIISTLLISLNASLISTPSILAETPTAQTYQSGFWQPVARVDLNRPITINLINKTSVIVDYAITEVEMKPIPIAPNQTIILDDVKPSLYIVIYPDTTSPRSSEIYLQYQVEVTGENIVEVTIDTTDDGGSSNRSFNLQKTGAIYLY